MAAGGGGLEQLMTAQMVQAAKVVEERLDEEMDRLDNMNDEELDKVRTSTRPMSRFHFYRVVQLNFIRKLKYFIWWMSDLFLSLV